MACPTIVTRIPSSTRAAGRAVTAKMEEDLRALRLTGDDVDFVRRYLGTLATGGTHDDEIREALALLAILEEECRGR